MRSEISLFLNERIQVIMDDLRQNNAEYALAVSKRSELYDLIDPILCSTEDISLKAADCLHFRQYMDQDFTTVAVMQTELYRQGYLDCVHLLRTLGVLA